MFATGNNLNEGRLREDRLNSKKSELPEGENPKTILQNSNNPGWQNTKDNSHVNSNWQKLRK